MCISPTISQKATVELVNHSNELNNSAPQWSKSKNQFKNWHSQASSVHGPQNIKRMSLFPEIRHVETLCMPDMTRFVLYSDSV